MHGKNPGSLQVCLQQSYKDNTEVWWVEMIKRKLKDRCTAKAAEWFCKCVRIYNCWSHDVSEPQGQRSDSPWQHLTLCQLQSFSVPPGCGCFWSYNFTTSSFFSAAAPGHLCCWCWAAGVCCCIRSVLGSTSVFASVSQWKLLIWWQLPFWEKVIDASCGVQLINESKPV